jgi:hypothetical protein
MTLKSPLSVRVEKPQKAFGVAMNEIRTWLDAHKIQPVDFRPDPTRGPGAVAFEIKFRREEEARLFEQTFVSQNGKRRNASVRMSVFGQTRVEG